MRNEKSERRKRKLDDRKRRERERLAAVARRAEFPEFVFDDTHADPEFAAVVRGAVEKFDFSELPAVEQTAFKIVRRQGAAVAINTLRAAMEAVRAEQPENAYAQLGDIAWTLTTGELVFDHIPETARQQFFPQNDFRTFHVGTFKGKPARMAAFYAFPKGAKKAAALLHLHGGGHRHTNPSRPKHHNQLLHPSNRSNGK